MFNNRRGCLEGFFELLLLNWLFDWLQRSFGFGRGCSCTGIGCGLVLLIIFLLLSCSIISGTDWSHLTRSLSGLI
ncbi:MAG: hypothetical protein ACUVWR_08150 [Anaerolineae bacterium]